MRSAASCISCAIGEALEALMETPPSLPQDFTPDVTAARAAIDDAVARRPHLARSDRDQSPARSLCDSDHAGVARAATPRKRPRPRRRSWPQATTVVVEDPVARHRPQVRRRRRAAQPDQRAGGARGSRRTFWRAPRPPGPMRRITGVTIHPMIVRPKARELIAGIADDPTFGPVVVFGRGGTAVEVINDKALALPPLDLKLARDLIARTRVSRMLKAYRDVPAADENAIALLLVKLAQLAADLPEMRELDLNPLLADENGVIAVDARVAVAPVEAVRRGPSATPALRNPALSEGMGTARHAAGRYGGLRAAGAAGGRAAVCGRSSGDDAGGPAPALLRAGQGIRPHLHRALHADRLCARHGVHRHRRSDRRNARRRAPARGRELRHRRICHPGPLRSQGHAGSAGC